MQLYADYIKEREGFNLEHGPNWFFSWKLIDNSMFIGDLYVSPGARRQGLASKLFSFMKAVGVVYGANKLTAEVHLDTVSGEKNLASFIKFGFKELKKDKNAITLFKEF